MMSFCTVGAIVIGNLGSQPQSGNLAISKPIKPRLVGGQNVSIELRSSAFSNGELMARRNSCDGDDISPPLSWRNLPSGVQSIALIVDDPDAPAGTWVHWLLFDLPADLNSLPEGLPKTENLSSGGRQGLNDFRRFGYDGPCPPRGTHRYFFKIFAVDSVLDLSGEVTKEKLLSALAGHVLATGQLIGRYRRK